MKDYSDKEIIECLRKRQNDVARYLSNRYRAMIRLMVIRMGGSSEDAKDIFQEGFTIMLKKTDDKNYGFTCKIKTYFFCVCQNLWKEELVKRKSATIYFSRRVDENDDIDFTEQMDKRLFEKIFHEVFATLDQSCRKIMKLYWLDKSPKEIAEQLKLTYGYVRKKKSEGQAEQACRVQKFILTVLRGGQEGEYVLFIDSGHLVYRIQ